MNRIEAFLIFICGCATAGCSPASSAPGRPTGHPAKYSLAETARQRDLVENAIVFVNIVLSDNISIRLQPSWQPATWYPSFSFAYDGGLFRLDANPAAGTCAYHNAISIPVYLIDDEKLGPGEVAFIPQGERCLFVNVNGLDGIFQRFFVAMNQEPRFSNFERVLVLCLILLHEVGHLHHNDDGSYGQAPAPLLDDMRKPSALISHPEVRADRFAAEQIEAAWLAQDDVRWQKIGISKSHIASRVTGVLMTAVNLHDFESDPFGVFDGRSKRETFATGGYSHHNLYLRLNTIVYQLEPTQDRRKRIERILHLISTGAR